MHKRGKTVRAYDMGTAVSGMFFSGCPYFRAIPRYPHKNLDILLRFSTGTIFGIYLAISQVQKTARKFHPPGGGREY